MTLTRMSHLDAIEYVKGFFKAHGEEHLISELVASDDLEEETSVKVTFRRDGCDEEGWIYPYLDAEDRITYTFEF